MVQTLSLMRKKQVLNFRAGDWGEVLTVFEMASEMTFTLKEKTKMLRCRSCQMCIANESSDNICMCLACMT